MLAITRTAPTLFIHHRVLVEIGAVGVGASGDGHYGNGIGFRLGDDGQSMQAALAAAAAAVVSGAGAGMGGEGVAGGGAQSDVSALVRAVTGLLGGATKILATQRRATDADGGGEGRGRRRGRADRHSRYEAYHSDDGHESGEAGSDGWDSDGWSEDSEGWKRGVGGALAGHLQAADGAAGGGGGAILYGSIDRGGAGGPSGAAREAVVKGHETALLLWAGGATQESRTAVLSQLSHQLDALEAAEDALKSKLVLTEKLTNANAAATVETSAYVPAAQMPGTATVPVVGPNAGAAGVAVGGEEKGEDTVVMPLGALMRTLEKEKQAPFNAEAETTKRRDHLLRTSTPHLQTARDVAEMGIQRITGDGPTNQGASIPTFEGVAMALDVTLDASTAATIRSQRDCFVTYRSAVCETDLQMSGMKQVG